VSWLGLEKKHVLVTGLANKKSVAYHVGRALEAEGAHPIWVVHTEERRERVASLLGDAEVHVCDVTDEGAIESLATAVLERHGKLDGLVHSIARADYSDGWKPFHETAREDFLRAVDVSCFSLIALARAFADGFAPEAAVVALSISTTTMAAENYGYMAPIKAALDSSLVFLAKSFSARGVRFNGLRAGLLKTSSSAGIPGYVDSWLHAERATLRGRGLETREVADGVLWLLSPRSSGLNAQGVVLDAGMSVNYFDQSIVRAVSPPEVSGGGSGGGGSPR
jgi:enoyl-[acyl-carrier protein] reductase I